jgi:transposase-like protein
MRDNINTAITGAYRAIHKKHTVRYLAEFEWCSNTSGISPP